jgi:hypothetical protein
LLEIMRTLVAFTRISVESPARRIVPCGISMPVISTLWPMCADRLSRPAPLS